MIYLSVWGKSVMRWRKVLKGLLFPRGWAALLCVAAAAGGLIYVFAGDGKESWAAYLIYAFSFYALTILCALLWKEFRHPKETADKVLNRLPLLRRWYPCWRWKRPCWSSSAGTTARDSVPL